MVLVIKPPITTIANGFDASDPIPADIAAGSKPMAAIMAVISIGRSLSSTPARKASGNDFQVAWCLSSFMLLLKRVINITPFCTHMPN